jgi:hypothetical protein
MNSDHGLRAAVGGVGQGGQVRMGRAKSATLTGRAACLPERTALAALGVVAAAVPHDEDGADERQGQEGSAKPYED